MINNAIEKMKQRFTKSGINTEDTTIYDRLDRIEDALEDIHEQVSYTEDKVADALRFTAIHKKQITDLSASVNRLLGYTSKNKTVSEGIISELADFKDELQKVLSTQARNIEDHHERMKRLESEISRTNRVFDTIKKAFNHA